MRVEVVVPAHARRYGLRMRTIGRRFRQASVCDSADPPLHAAPRVRRAANGASRRDGASRPDGGARRDGVRRAALLLSALALLGVTAPGGAGAQALPASRPIRVIDTDRMPTLPAGIPGWRAKTLFRGPAGARLAIFYIPPGAEGAVLHYHDFHEWAYVLSGDFTNNESTAPDQVMGPLQRFRQGHFLSRPPRSLHGGERGRLPTMASQLGATIMVMEEGDGAAATFTVDPSQRERQTAGMKYDPRFREILEWSNPRIIDTVDGMPWQAVEGSPGLSVKHLADVPARGFRATMYLLNAGASAPAALRMRRYEHATQFLFVIAGNLEFVSRDAGGSIERHVLGERHFVEQPPGSVAGLSPDAAETAAIWLEVTYARGTAWTVEATPIEVPTYLN